MVIVAEHAAQEQGIVALRVYAAIKAEATGALEGLFLDKVEPQVNEGFPVEIGIEARDPEILDSYALRAILDACAMFDAVEGFYLCGLFLSKV
jgi:hypothetical protein